MPLGTTYTSPVSYETSQSDPDPEFLKPESGPDAQFLGTLAQAAFSSTRKREALFWPARTPKVLLIVATPLINRSPPPSLGPSSHGRRPTAAAQEGGDRGVLQYSQINFARV